MGFYIENFWKEEIDKLINKGKQSKHLAILFRIQFNNEVFLTLGELQRLKVF